MHCMLAIRGSSLPFAGRACRRASRQAPASHARDDGPMDGHAPRQRYRPQCKMVAAAASPAAAAGGATCTICRDPFRTMPPATDVLRLSRCGHIFCAVCLQQWWGTSEQKNSCPSCRTIYATGLRHCDRLVASDVSTSKSQTKQATVQRQRKPPAPARDGRRGGAQQPLEIHLPSGASACRCAYTDAHAEEWVVRTVHIRTILATPLCVS